MILTTLKIRPCARDFFASWAAIRKSWVISASPDGDSTVVSDLTASVTKLMSLVNSFLTLKQESSSKFLDLDSKIHISST